MSTSSLSKTWRDQPSRGLFFGIGAIWHNVLRRLTNRRALQQLALVDPRLIRDMGLDPDQIRHSSGSLWDVFPAAGWMHRPADKR